MQDALHEVEKRVLLFTMICCNTFLSNLSAMEEAKKREKKARKETEETEKVKEKVKARVRKAGLGKDALIRQQNAKSSVQVQHVRHEMTW